MDLDGWKQMKYNVKCAFPIPSAFSIKYKMKYMSCNALILGFQLFIDFAILEFYNVIVIGLRIKIVLLIY